MTATVTSCVGSGSSEDSLSAQAVQKHLAGCVNCQNAIALILFGIFESANSEARGRQESGKEEITASISSGETVLLDRNALSKFRSGRWWIDPQKNGRLYVRGKVKDQDGSLRQIFLHRFVVDAKPNERVFHRNGNGMDNRRCNLRITPPRERSMGAI